MSGFEVLTRWEHAELGAILPEGFIGLADQEGLIGSLTEQVLRCALTEAAALKDPPHLSVNVSPSQLRDSSLPELLGRIGAETGYALDLLTMEITETALVDDMKRSQQVVGELKELGCRLSLDDFGTGYSSLHHLSGLPFDELKVDRSFVGSMLDVRESRKIVAAVIGLGRTLGLETVAEGIESQRQAEMLSWLGCDVGQGWLYGRPAGVASLQAMVAQEFSAWTKADAGRGGGDPWRSSLEARPEQQLALLEAIYDGVPCFISCLDRSLRFVSINKRLAELNGCSVEEHLGRPMKEVVPHIFERVEKYLLRALHGEAVSDVEVFREAREPGQREKTLLASYQPMLDEAGEVTGVLVGMVDITARKRAEAALRRRQMRPGFFSVAAI